jgi:hypothetical protein
MSQRTATAIPAAVLAAACSTYVVLIRGRGFHIAWVESLSQFASVPAGIALLVYCRRSWQHPTPVSAVVWGAACFVAGGTKVTLAVLAVGAVGLVVVDLVLRRPPHMACRASLATVGLVGSVVSLWAFADLGVESTTTSGLLRPFWPVSWVLTDLERWYNDSLAKWIVVMLFLIAGTSGAIPLALTALRDLRSGRDAPALRVALLGGGITAFLLTGVISATEPFYGLHTMTALAWLVLAVATLHLRRRSRDLWPVVAGIPLAILTLFGDVEVTDPDQIVWIYVVRPALPFLVVLGLALSWLLVSRSATSALRVGAGLFVGAAITIAVVQWWDQRTSDYREWSHHITSTDADRVALYGWLDEDAPSDAVVASISDVLTSEVRLREAVASPTMGYPFPPYRAERLEALRAMYTVPDCSESGRQVARGVTLAVATAEEAAVGALDACATRAYENAAYVVYDLTKAP